MRFAVVGSPIAHSKSPALHAAAYRALGLAHTYEAIDVDAAHFPEVVQALKRGDLQGISVTVPHKLRAFELADQAAASAKMLGAANTLVRDPSGRITAHNTDVGALRAELEALGEGRDFAAARALVIGAGGAARAAIAALADLGVEEIVVRARNPAAAESLKSIAPVTIAKLSSEKSSGFDVIIQATSAGMQGAGEGQSIADCVDWKRLAPGAMAYDVVYAPRETPFLRAAKHARISAENGLGMLARQGAAAFELWLAIPAPLAIMRRALDE